MNTKPILLALSKSAFDEVDKVDNADISAGYLRKERLIEALNAKFNEIKDKLKTINCELKPRVPFGLSWIGKEFAFSVRSTAHAPKKYASLHNPTKHSIDQIARTFCALEEFEAWMDRVVKGQQKHQLEMEKQAAASITRLETYAIFRDKSKDKNKDYIF